MTYNYARSLFFMEKIEKKYNRGDISEIKKNILHYMLNNKKYWKDYYTGKKSKVKNLILNSKLDRMRYYLNQKKIILSINKLRKNINRLNIAKIKKHLFQKENKIF